MKNIVNHCTESKKEGCKELLKSKTRLLRRKANRGQLSAIKLLIGAVDIQPQLTL